MKNISYDGPGGPWLADLSAWLQENSEDNNEQLTRLLRNLRLARQQVLTPRQQQMLTLYYDQGLTMGQIALKLHVNRSTVSRTLRRAKLRLYQSLRFSL